MALILIIGNNGIGKSYQIKNFIKKFESTTYEKPYTKINNNIFIVGKYNESIKYPGLDALGKDKFIHLEKCIEEYNPSAGKTVILDMTVLSKPKIDAYLKKQSSIKLVFTTLDLYQNIQYLKQRSSIVTDETVLNLILKHRYIKNIYNAYYRTGYPNLFQIPIEKLESFLLKELEKTQ